MPFVGRSVEPVHIRRGVIGASDVSLGGEHEALANGSLACVLRQISDLCLFAEGLQRELLDESARVAARCVRLSRRARDIADRINRLNVLDEPLPECSLLEAAERGARRCSNAYRTTERRQECCLFTPDSRPPCIRSMYVRAAAPVRLRVAATCSLPPNGASLPRKLHTVGPTNSAVAAADTAMCGQPCLEPVVARPWPVAVGLPLVKPRKIRRRRSNGVLREPRLSTAHQMERDAAVSLSGQHSTVPADASASTGHDQQRLPPSCAVIAVNTSADAFDRLAANRAVASGRAGRPLGLRRRLTLSGSPAELAGLRSHVEASLRLTTSDRTARVVVSPLSRHLDLQPSTAVSSKDPDTYLTDDSSGFASFDTRQRQSVQQRPSLFGRWLQRSRSLPRDFGRRLASSESADSVAAAVGRSRGATAAGIVVTTAGGALLDDRRQTVFINFYGEPMPQPPSVKPGVAGRCSAPPAQCGSIGGEQRLLESWPECSAGVPKHRPAARRSRSQLELPRVGSLLRSKPLPHRRSSSAERPPRERSTAAVVGESFLSHTLPCLFRRKTSSDEEATAPAPRSSSSEAVVKGYAAVARSAASSAGHRTSSAPAARSSRRPGASAQLPAGGVVLRRRDSRVVAPRTAATSTSSGHWSSSDRYSFGSDGNSSATSSHHRLCSSHASVDHDSAVCMDGGSRGDSRLGGSSELHVLPVDALPVLPQRLPSDGQRATRCCGYCDDDKDVFDVEPLFVLQPDSEVLSLYSVDQDGFYTTMHSDSLLLENVAGRTDDVDAHVRSQLSIPRQVTLCDGAAQTEVTFGDESPAESRQLAVATATVAEPSHLLAGADCHRSLPAFSAAACTSSNVCDDNLRCDGGSSIQMFHSLVPVTPDASDDEREEDLSSHRPLWKQPEVPAAQMPLAGAEASAKWHNVVAPLPMAAAVTAAAATTTVSPTCEPTAGESWSAASVEPHLKWLNSGGEAGSAHFDILPSAKSAAAAGLSHGVTATSALTAEEDSSSQSPAASAPGPEAPARARPPEPPARRRSRLSSTGSQSLASSTASDDRSCPSSASRLSLVGNAPSPVVVLATATPYVQPGQERSASTSDRCSTRRQEATNAQKVRTPRVAVQRACDYDDDDDGTSCCGSETDTADFPRMEADSAALSVATERCLSVLAERFKIKDSSPSVSDAVSLAPDDSTNGGGGDSLVSSLIEQARRMSFYSCAASSLDDGFGRATSQPVARATCATSRHRLSNGRHSTVGGSSPCDLLSEEVEQPDRAVCHLPAGGSKSSHNLSSQMRDCFSASSNRQSGSPTAGVNRSPGDVADRARSDAACSRPGSSRSCYAPSTAHPLCAFDASSGASRNVSYRIANAVQPLIDGSMVAVCSRNEEAFSQSMHTNEAAAAASRTTTKAELGSDCCYSIDVTMASPSMSSSSLPIAPTQHQPSPPPRAFSYRVANDRKQLCDSSVLGSAAVVPSATSPSGLVAGGRLVRSVRQSPSSAAAPGGGCLAGVREFMKGVYENSDHHLPPLPLAPTTVDLVPIVTATSLRPSALDRGSRNCIGRGGGSGDHHNPADAGVPPLRLPWLPMSVRATSSTFLPGHESSASIAVSGTHSSAAGEPPTSGDWADEGPSCPTSLRLNVFDGGATVPRRHGERPPPHGQLQTERPRSTILTKGDRHELEWMQNNFASLLRRCFNDDDCCAYASLEALRQDESSLLSLMDAVQEHTTRSPKIAATENTVFSAAAAATAAAIEAATVTSSATAASAAGVLQAATQSGGRRQAFVSVAATKSSREALLVPMASEAASQCTHTEV